MSTEMRGILVPGKRMAYALAGKSTITVRGKTTRFTYQIKKIANQEKWFVGLLNGPDNNCDYMYIGLGTMDKNATFTFRLTRNSRAGDDAQSVIAFKWLVRHWESPLMEIWHEGACGRCGRKLTVPESIESGLGPTCAGYSL